MSSLPATFAEDVIDQPARAQFEVFLDEHRGALNGCLDGLTDLGAWPTGDGFVEPDPLDEGRVFHQTQQRGPGRHQRSARLLLVEGVCRGGADRAARRVLRAEHEVIDDPQRPGIGGGHLQDDVEILRTEDVQVGRCGPTWTS
jgi:hypothetical protein